MTIDDDLRNSLLLAMSEVHSGNGKEGQAILEAILSALEAKGLVIVPSEPTEGMLVDGSASLRNFYSEEGPYPRTKAVYRAMLAARGG